jgi:hypothetical protein
MQRSTSGGVLPPYGVPGATAPADYDRARRASSSSTSEHDRSLERLRGEEELTRPLAGVMSGSRQEQQMRYEMAQKDERDEEARVKKSQRVGGKAAREGNLDQSAAGRSISNPSAMARAVRQRAVLNDPSQGQKRERNTKESEAEVQRRFEAEQQPSNWRIIAMAMRTKGCKKYMQNRSNTALVCVKNDFDVESLEVNDLVPVVSFLCLNPSLCCITSSQHLIHLGLQIDAPVWQMGPGTKWKLASAWQADINSRETPHEFEKVWGNWVAKHGLLSDPDFERYTHTAPLLCRSDNCYMCSLLVGRSGASGHASQ